MFKRLFWLAVLGGAGFAAWSLLRGSRAEQPPPRQTAEQTSDPANAAAGPAAPVVAVADWVAPVDGACPATHPVKANDNSGIFHVPGGRFYERTRPERCYATPEAASADGYRAAKS